MIQGYNYNPDKKTVTSGDKTINFYCGPDFTPEARTVLDLYFGNITPQHALVDIVTNQLNILKGPQNG